MIDIPEMLAGLPDSERPEIRRAAALGALRALKTYHGPRILIARLSGIRKH